jgi:hypothetical protein
MDWLPHFGGSVLALVNRGRVIATISGPHPAGWALTVEATRATTMHRSIVVARTAGERLACRSALQRSDAADPEP